MITLLQERDQKIAELLDELAEIKIKLKSANETIEIMQIIIDTEKTS
jgi:hypothetical protein